MDLLTTQFPPVGTREVTVAEEARTSSSLIEFGCSSRSQLRTGHPEPVKFNPRLRVLALQDLF